jgi:hypothetical protein
VDLEWTREEEETVSARLPGLLGYVVFIKATGIHQADECTVFIFMNFIKYPNEYTLSITFIPGKRPRLLLLLRSRAAV